MKRMDEMEISVTAQALRVAWAYTVVFLFVWMVYDWIHAKTLGLPFLLFMSQNLIFLGLQQYLKWKLSKDEK